MLILLNTSETLSIHQVPRSTASTDASPTPAMDTRRLGSMLVALCLSGEGGFTEIKELLESLTEEQRREAMRYIDRVIDS